MAYEKALAEGKSPRDCFAMMLAASGEPDPLEPETMLGLPPERLEELGMRVVQCNPDLRTRFEQTDSGLGFFDRLRQVYDSHLADLTEPFRRIASQYSDVFAAARAKQAEIDEALKRIAMPVSPALRSLQDSIAQFAGLVGKQDSIRGFTPDVLNRPHYEYELPEIEPSPVFEIPDLLRSAATEQRSRDDKMVEARTSLVRTLEELLQVHERSGRTTCRQNVAMMILIVFFGVLPVIMGLYPQIIRGFVDWFASLFQAGTP